MTHRETLRSAEGTRPAVELDRVSRRFGAVRALEEVSLSLERGRLTSILGPNGAGKTTAVKLMLGILRPSGGKVRVLGGDPTHPAQRTRVGAMMQVSSLPAPLRVIELVELFRTYYPAPLATAEILERAGLLGLERRLYGKLSGGQKQRLTLALAICGDPQLLFLDEPTVGLDVETRRALWAQVRAEVERGKTVVLTTHYLEEADALSDRIVVLHEGQIRADGTPHQIKASASARKIRCVTRVTPDQALQLPGVREARYDRAKLEVLAPRSAPVIRELLRLDPELCELEVAGTGIEEAFLHLTSPSAGSPHQEVA